MSKTADGKDGKVELLSALGWDLRSLGEAQVRSLTAMQRCIDDFRKTRDKDAVAQIRKHIRELEVRSPQVQESLRLLREVLTEIDLPAT